MAHLNKDKCFEQSKDIVIALPDEAVLEADWLNRLGTLCAAALGCSEEGLKENFQKHAGDGSTYSLKQNLVGGLQIIYKRLSAVDKEVLTDSEKAAIATKLQEGAAPCTPGFHDRVNDVISGFIIPNTLVALLTQIRKSIIETAARQSTDEVHAHNRFSIVASMAGYGIKPINWNDAYRGEFSDDTIREKIDLAFKENYQPFSILQNMSEAIKGILHSQFEYTGAKEAGYKGETIGKCLDYLRTLFHDLEWDPADYIIQNEEGEVTDLNWKRIKQSLFNVLDNQKYILLAENERNFITRLLGEDATIPPASEITPLFNEGFIHNTAELNNFMLFFDITSLAMQHQLVTAYINQCPASEKFTALGEIMKAFKAKQDLIAALKIFILDEKLITEEYLDTVCTSRADDQKRENEIKIVLDLFTHFNDAQQKKMLMPAWGSSNALMLASRHHPHAVVPILEVINRLGLEQQEKILLQTSGYGENALMLAAQSHPQAVAPILEAISKLGAEEQKKILMQTSGYGENALMLAAQSHPQAVAPILEAISRLGAEEQKKILMQTGGYGRNALMLAAQSNPQALAKILEAISKLGTEEQKKILMQISGYGENALMFAAQSHPQAVAPILEAISRLGAEEQKKILMQTNGYGKNALMVAAVYQPQAVVPILEAISKLGAEEQKKILMQTSGYGENALMLAAQYQPQAVTPILEAISRLGAEQQKKILVKTNGNGKNALMLAAVYQPEAVAPILEAISRLGAEEQKKILMQTSGGYNALRLAAQWQPQAVTPILAAISVLKPEIQKKIVPNTISFNATPEIKMELALTRLTLDLALLKEKADYFKTLPNAEAGENTPFQVATKLHTALQNSLNTFKSSQKSAQDITELEETWKKSIEESRPVLSQHRGIMKNTIPRLLAWLGILLSAAFLVANYARERIKNNNSYGFFSPMKTKTERLLDEMDHTVKTPRKI